MGRPWEGGPPPPLWRRQRKKAADGGKEDKTTVGLEGPGGESLVLALSL